MATLVELGCDDVLVVRVGPEDQDDFADEVLSTFRELLGCRAVMVLAPDMTISSRSADEVLRAVAGT